MKDWPANRDKMPFQAMPVLEVDGRSISQSNTINRYVGKLAGLYPKDDWQAALCDEVMDAAEDIGSRIGNTMQMGADEKKKAREALAAGAIPRFLEQLEIRLKAGGSEWYVENRLSVADLKVFGLVRWLRSGALDHIPKDMPDALPLRWSSTLSAWLRIPRWRLTTPAARKTDAVSKDAASSTQNSADTPSRRMGLHRSTQATSGELT